MMTLIIVFQEIINYFKWKSSDFEEQYTKINREKKINKYNSKQLYYKI